MTNSESRTHYYVRIAANGNPVIGSMVARTKMPKTDRWMDITACLGVCCLYVSPRLNSPANFAALTPAEDSATSINLLWTAVTGATSYTVERSTTADFVVPIAVYSGTATNTTASGLTANTTYYFRLKAEGTTDAKDSAYTYASRSTTA